MSFEKILEMQARVQREAYPAKQNMTFEQAMLSDTRALIHEVIEVERELNWKHWKTPVPVNMENVKDEITDIQIFLMNLIVNCGMDADELYERILKKQVINVERQMNGY